MQATKAPRVKIIFPGNPSKVHAFYAPTHFHVDDTQSQNLNALALKVNHLIVDHQYKMYIKHFLNKPIKFEYYIDEVVESDIDI